MTLIDVLEILGALLILFAFAATQLRRMGPHSPRYLVLNSVGAGILAVIAGIHRSWGFLLLEGTWTVVSLVSLARAARDGRSRADGPADRDPGPAGGTEQHGRAWRGDGRV